MQNFNYCRFEEAQPMKATTLILQYFFTKWIHQKRYDSRFLNRAVANAINNVRRGLPVGR